MTKVKTIHSLSYKNNSCAAAVSSFAFQYLKTTLCGHQDLSVLDTCWEYWSGDGFTILVINRSQTDLNNPMSLYIEYYTSKDQESDQLWI